VLNLIDELRRLRDALEASRVEYGLCGGLAMAVHGYPRATIDIDLIVRDDDVERVLSIAEGIGFQIRALPMRFSGGKLRIRRITKLDASDGSALMLDLLILGEELEHVWDDLQRLRWEGSEISVVSREGLIALKRLRSSAQDLADIERLE
jgi:hypothetical protein